MSAINVNSITGRTGSHGPVLTGVTTISGDLHVGSGLSVTGVSTLSNTVVGGATTELVVGGDARITGVLTVGQGSVTINGDSSLNTISGVTTVYTTAINDLNYPTAGPLSNRNLIINGAMQVAQRGTSATNLSNTDSGYYTVDRFRFGEQGVPTCEFTNTQSTDAPSGFSNSFRLDTTTAESPMGAANVVFTDYRVEAQDLQRLGYGTADAKSITLSFYVKSTVSGTYVVWFYSPDGAAACTHTYTIAPGEVNTWQYRTITVAGDTSNAIDNDNGIGFFIRFALAAGTDWTSGTASTTWTAASVTNANRFPGQTANVASSTLDDWSITGVQLEVGDTATSFEHRSYGDELARCSRYYETCRIRGTLFNVNSSSGSSCPLIVQCSPKRITPTADLTEISRLKYIGDALETSNISSITYGEDDHGLTLNLARRSATAAQDLWFTNNAKISLDAEL